MARAVEELASAVAALEPGRLDGTNASRLLDLFVKAERLAAAGRTLLARRVDESKVWQRHGHRTAGEWLAARTGTSTGQAIGMLETARNLDDAPLTRQEFSTGRISEAQAREVSSAVAAEPRAERELLSAAKSQSLAGLRERCRAVRMSAVSDALDAYEASRRRRYLRLWSEANGDVRVDGRFPADDGAAVAAAVDRLRDQLFGEARRAGRREPSEAYAADALVQLVSGTGRTGRSWPRAMVHVLVDRAVLDRGFAEPGERCEIPGVAPIPAATARAFTHDAIIKALVANGSEITRVAHVGRTIPARLRTALEVRDPECVVPGCNVRRGLEIDHYRVPYADGGPASLDNLARECRWHHYLRTHCGYRLSGGPGAWLWETPDQIEGTPGDPSEARPPARRTLIPGADIEPKLVVCDAGERTDPCSATCSDISSLRNDHYGRSAEEAPAAQCDRLGGPPVQEGQQTGITDEPGRAGAKEKIPQARLIGKDSAAHGLPGNCLLKGDQVAIDGRGGKHQGRVNVPRLHETPDFAGRTYGA